MDNMAKKKGNLPSNNKGKDVVTQDILTEAQLDIEYKKHDISIQYVELFNEFSVCLLTIIHKTYFGSEYIKTIADIEGHYNWCFKIVNDKYTKIGFNFTDTKDVYNYFLKHVTGHIYKNKDYKPDDVVLDIDFINRLLSFEKNKVADELYIMIELYYTFKKSMK